MKKITLDTFKKKIKKNEPHLRWGLETEKAHNPEMGSYYFAFVGDDRTIQKSSNKLFSDMRNAGGLVDILRDDEGSVVGTNLNYKLYVVESRANDNIVKGSDIGIPKIEDFKMYDRVRGSYIRKSDGVGQEFSIERYIADFYSK